MAAGGAPALGGGFMQPVSGMMEKAQIAHTGLLTADARGARARNHSK